MSAEQIVHCDGAPVGFGPETWTGKKIGRALAFIHILANSKPEDWRSKEEIHASLAEFRDPLPLPTPNRAPDHG